MARRAVVPITEVPHKEWGPGEVRAAVRSAFQWLGADNPLRRMDEADQEIVWGMLWIFAGSKNKPPKHIDPLEPLAQAVTEAANLAVKIEQLLQKDHGKALNELLTSSRDLPARLGIFANQVGGLLSALGETGFKRKRAMEDVYLIQASEFVRLKTGTWNDEHLAELLQGIEPAPEKFSGDAIHKTRERFRKNHPELYEVALWNIATGQY